MVMNPLIFGPRGRSDGPVRMWNERGSPSSIDGRLPERVVHRIVVVRERGVPRHHHAAQAERLDAFEIADPVLDRAHRGLSDAEQTVRVRRRILADPLVVRREARVLEVEVRMIAQHHADGRVEDLRGHAVAILIDQPRVRIPAAAMELLEPDAEHGQVLGPLPGRGHETHRNGLREPLDDEEIAALRIAHDVRRAIAELRVDPVDVGVGRLGDVRVGGDDRFRHDELLS